MTPKGSLKRSKRETWSSSGRSGSMPKRASVSSRSASGIGQFLSDSGSMDGGMRNIGQPSGRVKAAMEKIAAS